MTMWDFNLGVQDRDKWQALVNTVKNQNQQMHTSLWKYIINIVYLLHVSATHVAILREVRYEE
jgi:hypothetical protein